MISKMAMKIKAELLCYGVKPTKSSKTFYAEQNPHSRVKEGNVGLHSLLENTSPVLITTNHKFNKKSPFELKREGNYWFLFKNKRKIMPIFIINAPKWYSKKTSTGTPMSEIFLHEGRNFLHQAYKGCGFFDTGEQCKFCATGKKIELFSPEEYAEVVKEALKENPNYEVCLSGGTTLTPDRGALYHLKNIISIRKISRIVPIFVEMAPPDENKYLDMLIKAGASCFSINIEIWDNKIRRKICPGKSVISKKRYLEVYKYIRKKIGDNKVTCVFVAGLEPKKSLIKGIETITKLGVKPDIMPFKPFNGSMLKNLSPTSPNLIIEVAKKTAYFMKKYNIDYQKTHGCSKCGACTLENDWFDVKK